MEHVNRPPADRLRALIDTVVDSLDEPLKGADLARRVYLSRFHFNRLFKAAVRETPGAFRQRLLLERAGYQLRGTGNAVTEIALDAGYSSPEAFTRAFRRAFGLAPSEFRGSARPDFQLPTRNGVHFHPPCGLLVAAAQHKRRTAMDLIDRLLEHDLWLNRRLLARAGELPDTQLDAPLALDHKLLPFEAHEPTVRAMLDRLVFTKETWTAAIAGRPSPTDQDRSLDGLRRRLDASGPEFVRIVRGVRDRGQWDSAFIDALCDPPESFTFGGMVAHVLTFSAYRRQQLLIALGQQGIQGLGIGDPIEWERALAS
jgi:AraC-like DNA-binding protein